MLNKHRPWDVGCCRLRTRSEVLGGGSCRHRRGSETVMSSAKRASRNVAPESPLPPGRPLPRHALGKRPPLFALCCDSATTSAPAAGPGRFLFLASALHSRVSRYFLQRRPSSPRVTDAPTSLTCPCDPRGVARVPVLPAGLWLPRNLSGERPREGPLARWPWWPPPASRSFQNPARFSSVF